MRKQAEVLKVHVFGCRSSKYYSELFNDSHLGSDGSGIGILNYANSYKYRSSCVDTRNETECKIDASGYRPKGCHSPKIKVIRKVKKYAKSSTNKTA